MKMCQKHWDELREAIRARGIYHLVAKSGQEAVKNVMTEVQGGDADFDPLMTANFAIWHHALELGGLYLMGQDDNGNEYCPLCELDKHTGLKDGEDAASKQWITGCCDAQLEHAREMGLVPQPS